MDFYCNLDVLIHSFLSYYKISTIQTYTYICAYTPGGPLWGGYGVVVCPSLVSLSHVIVYKNYTVLSVEVDWDTWDIYWEIAMWRLTGGSPICLMATEWSICTIKLPKLP